MDIYASDDEKSEEIKQWWRENGLSVVVGLAFGIVLIFAGRYWINHQAATSEQASQSYQQLATLLTEDKKAEADEITQRLFSEYSSTPYAVFAAFDMAKKAAEQNDNEAAETYLQWTIDHADLAGHKALAQLRLSQVLLAESKYDLAINLLSQPTLVSFKSLFSETQGDVLVAQGKNGAARAAYQIAMATLGQGEPRQSILQLKLDNVATDL